MPLWLDAAKAKVAVSSQSFRSRPYLQSRICQGKRLQNQKKKFRAFISAQQKQIAYQTAWQVFQDTSQTFIQNVHKMFLYAQQKYMLSKILCLVQSGIGSLLSVYPGANFIELLSRKKLLTRKICLADFFGYQPNFHTKCMHFGWESVLCFILLSKNIC